MLDSVSGQHGRWHQRRVPVATDGLLWQWARRSLLATKVLLLGSPAWTKRTDRRQDRSFLRTSGDRRCRALGARIWTLTAQTLAPASVSLCCLSQTYHNAVHNFVLIKWPKCPNLFRHVTVIVNLNFAEHKTFQVQKTCSTRVLELLYNARREGQCLLKMPLCTAKPKRLFTDHLEPISFLAFKCHGKPVTKEGHKYRTMCY